MQYSEKIGEKPIFFVVHSLGGLIVKQLLRSQFDEDQDHPLATQTKGIFFFATPHVGSDLSKLVQWLRFYRPSILVKELETAAAPLRDLNHWYRANSERLGIATTVFSETQKTKGSLVVDQLSSDPGIPSANLIPVDANHTEICKVDLDSMPYKTVRNAIEQFVREHSREIELSRESPVWMHVSCFNKYPDQWEERSVPKSESQILRYTAESNPRAITIEPKLPYLDDVRDGHPVWSISYMWQPFRWLPLTLDLKFLNTSDETVYLTDLELNVKKSHPNTEPVLFVKSGESFPSLSISNDGWGRLCSPRLKLAFADGVGQPSFPGQLPFEVSLADFSDFHELDLSDQFTELGVDVEAVMNRHPNPELGPFPSRRAFVYGQLDFADENGQSRIFKFGTDMRIEGPLLGMFGPPSFEYQTRLQVEGEDYRQSVGISHVIKSNEYDRFLLQLDVDKSSSHELTISVKGNKGTAATSLPLHVSLFVPRSVHERIADRESQNPFFFK